MVTLVVVYENVERLVVVRIVLDVRNDVVNTDEGLVVVLNMLNEVVTVQLIVVLLPVCVV